MSKNPDVSRDIHPSDQMWKSGREWYFSVGESGARVVRLLVDAAYSPPVNRILDLPCGHGRVGRFLRAAYPSASITFCDIDRTGADFCAATLGGSPLYSDPDLSAVDLGGPYDVVWVGSLFTHVDETRTRRWLDHLCGALAPGGVLAATFHGRWTREVQRIHPVIGAEAWEGISTDCDATGYGYRAYEGQPDYGISLCRASKVMEIAEGLPDVRVLTYAERGWADNHDVLGLLKCGRRYSATLRNPPAPQQPPLQGHLV